MSSAASVESLSRPWHEGLTAKALASSDRQLHGMGLRRLRGLCPHRGASLRPARAASAGGVEVGAGWAGIAIGITLLGWGIGGVIGGTMADYIGRKRMMVYSVLLYGILSGITALSTSFWMLAGLRFLTGLALGSEWSTGVSMVAETWPDRARPKGAGLLQSGFGWGTLLAALIWWGLSRYNFLGPQTWRLMFVVGAIPALFTLYIRRAIDESERWQKAVREQRWAATEQASDMVTKPSRRPFSLAEIFRERESRKRVLLAFLMSLATMVGWWAISSWLPVYHAGTGTGPGIRQSRGVGRARRPLLYQRRRGCLFDLGVRGGRHRAQDVPVPHLRRRAGDDAGHLPVDTLRRAHDVCCLHQRLLHPGLCLLLDGHLPGRTVFQFRAFDRFGVRVQRHPLDRMGVPHHRGNHDPALRRHPAGSHDSRADLYSGIVRPLVRTRDPGQASAGLKLFRRSFFQRMGGIQIEVQFQHVDPRLAQEAELPAFGVLGHQAPQLVLAHAALAGHARDLESAAAGVMSGSRPEAEVVTRSTGTGLPGFSACKVATSCFTRSMSFWLVGPRFEPPELAAS